MSRVHKRRAGEPAHNAKRQLVPAVSLLSLPPDLRAHFAKQYLSSIDVLALRHVCRVFRTLHVPKWQRAVHLYTSAIQQHGRVEYLRWLRCDLQIRVLPDALLEPAAAANRIAALEYLVSQRKSLYQPAIYKHFAAYGHFALLDEVLTYAAAATAAIKNKFDVEVLYCAAAAHGRVDVLRWLDADLRFLLPADRYIWVFAAAAAAGRIEVLEYLDVRVASADAGCWDYIATDVVCKNQHAVLRWLHERNKPLPSSLLETAVQCGHLAMARYLHEEHAPPYAWFSECTLYAVQSTRLDIVRYVHEHGAVWHSKTYRIAAQCGSLDILRYVCEHGTLITAQKQVLVEAVSTGNLSVVEYVLAHGATLSTKACRAAARLVDPTILRLLREQCSPPCPWDMTAVRAAYQSAEYGCTKQKHYVSTLRFLLEQGAPCDTRLRNAAWRLVHRREGSTPQNMRRSARLMHPVCV